MKNKNFARLSSAALAATLMASSFGCLGVSAAEVDKASTGLSVGPSIEVSNGLTGFKDLGASAVSNTGSGKIVIWSFNDELKNLLDEYSSVPFEYVDMGNGDQTLFRERLDKALASGTNVPDLIVAESDCVREYADSGYILPINSIGVDYKDLTEMYNYTLQYAANGEGVIKGISWQACPSGVFYNRTLAKKYLGVSDPASVQKYFSTWDNFLAACRTVNSKSGGKVKGIAGFNDLLRTYLGSRTSSWIKNGEIQIDPVITQFMDLSKTLADEDLTWWTNLWTDEWREDSKNQSTLAFFGPMWLGDVLDFDNPDANPTAGDWGLVEAPVPYAYGGSWIMATKFCDRKADARQIMYDICINKDSLESMAKNGEFVNNASIMKTIANDPSYKLDWLGGQNPASVLLNSALSIDYSAVGPYDYIINDMFADASWRYATGNIPQKINALKEFQDKLIKAGLVSPEAEAPTIPPENLGMAGSGVDGFAERLYTTCLGRDAEEAGKNYWADELKKGKSGADAASGFFFSDELNGQNISDREYITRLYKTFMNRLPDETGIAYWLGEMKKGRDRMYVFEGFVNSQEWADICLNYGIRSGGNVAPSFEKPAPEAVKGFSKRLYTTCLCRDAEQAGLSYWAQELTNLRKTGTEVAYGFFFSQEFVDQKLSDKEYVTRLYKTFMNRDPESEGFNYWIGEMKKGTNREAVFYGFAGAPEFAKLCAEAGIIA